MRGRDVGYWHLADIETDRLMSVIGGKADIAFQVSVCLLLTQSGHQRGLLQ